ncbi:MAG: exonuclease domain-containing protein [Spirochaetales bacterium]|nr:exonuclease domain-containing protein [Spirochaetales bacterium]MDD7611825.1 exonuclease domain-containing protein [Spirochaetales bacterium]MDY5914085.1 3'-5' exonuclease [Treponema sp.]
MADFEFPTDPMEICPCLFNTESYFSRCVGFCDFHKAYLTTKQLKTKNCLGKQCNALIRQNSHPFWLERSLHKLDKRLKKEEAAAKLNSIETKSVKSPKSEVQQTKQKRYICLDLEMSELTSKERKPLKGLKGEVILIGAVMLDENFKCISQFNTYVKPVYGSISEEITNITGITNDDVVLADTFSSAMYKLYSWAGNDDITTFCWSESDYKQLWDEIYIKARNHDEYRNFLKTFVDLQAALNRILKTKKSLSLDAAMKLCHLKFKGQRHTAFADAFNTARILNKVQSSNSSLDELPKLATYIETNISRRFDANISKDKDFTSSIASFIAPELLQQFGYKESTNERKMENQTDSQNRVFKLLSKKIDFIKYGIKFPIWFNFSIKMLLSKDMKIEKAA